jgi:LacI family transcriptional regulator
VEEQVQPINQKRKKHVSMKEVARLAGVSVSTVSHVINNTRFVSEDTKEKVLESIEILNFKPNIMAQGIKGRKSKTIGLIVSNLSGSFFYRLVNAVCRYMHARGYDVLVCNSEENIENERRHIDVLLRKGIDGLIYAPVDHRSQYEELLSNQVPFVQIERKSDYYNTDYIGINDFEESVKATNFLIGLGCRKIGFIRHGTENYTGLRFEGYMQACIGKNIYDKDYVKNISQDSVQGKNQLQEWLNDVLPLDGIICSNGNLLYLLLTIFDEQKDKAADNIHIFSFDKNKWLDLLKYPVYSLEQPIEDIGSKASEILLKKLEEEIFGLNNYYLDCEIVEHNK